MKPLFTTFCRRLQALSTGAASHTCCLLRRAAKHAAASAAALALLACPLLLCGCEGEDETPGLGWQIPDEEQMPYGFSMEENVPGYVRAWRMPEGFAGFTERWNERARDHLAREVEISKQKLARAITAQLYAVPGTEGYIAAAVDLRSAWVNLRQLQHRIAQGNYLSYHEEHELPQDLQWQTGSEQPELGSPEARKGGTLRIALQRSFPNTLRPFGPNSNHSTRRYIYDDIDLGLVRIHPGTGELIPGTADRWAVSEDGQTVYFHIDPAATFSNGARLTARDFITALYVRTSPHSVEPFYNSYYLGNFSRIATYGDSVVAVTLTSPRPYAPYFAAIPPSCTSFYAEFGPDYPTRYLWRVPPTLGGYTVDPAGTIMGRQLTMKRVRNWWARERQYTRYSCNVDSIVYAFVSETTKARELFRIGELDIFSAREAMHWYEGLEIEPVHKGYIQRVHFNNIWPRSSFGFHLNCSQEPFNNKFMRAGFHYALNIQKVINTIFRGDYSRLGSYFSGFGPYTNEKIRALPYDPARARWCFRKAGYTKKGPDGFLRKPDGTPLQVTVSARIDPLYTDCLHQLREEAARCGLDLRIEQMDDTLFFQKVMDKQYAAALYSWGFSPPLPDPTPFFHSSYAYRENHSSSNRKTRGNSGKIPATGTNNITATSSAKLDAAILACQTARSVNQAIRAHHRAQRLIANTYAWVPGWTTSYWRFAQWRWVRWPDTPECRFCPPRYYDPLDSHLYWIDEDIKRETQRARAEGRSFPEEELNIPVPPQGLPAAARNHHPEPTDRT